MYIHICVNVRMAPGKDPLLPKVLNVCICVGPAKSWAKYIWLVSLLFVDVSVFAPLGRLPWWGGYFYPSVPRPSGASLQKVAQGLRHLAVTILLSVIGFVLSRCQFARVVKVRVWVFFLGGLVVGTVGPLRPDPFSLDVRVSLCPFGLYVRHCGSRRRLVLCLPLSLSLSLSLRRWGATSPLAVCGSPCVFILTALFVLDPFSPHPRLC